MNAREQFYTNIGMALTVGVYGIINTPYSEIMKPSLEQNGTAIAILLVVGLVMLAITIGVFQYANSSINDRESHH